MGIERLRWMPLAADPGDDTLEEKISVWHKLVNHYWDLVTDTSMWETVIQVAVRIILIFLVSRVAKIIINRLIDHFANPKSSKRFKLRSRRVQTVGKLMKNTASYVLNFIVILLILGEFHINLAPFLAGAGVIGLAIGFGAQSLVKDVISGFFIILEDHFSVGDVIETGKFKGTVEMIGLRATRLKSWTGEVFIIPNGSIIDVTNYSVSNSLAVVDVSIAATQQLDEAMDRIRGVLHKFEDPNLIGTPELLGVQSMTASDIVLRITATCRPNTQSSLTRRLNAELKKGLEAAGDPRYAPALERTGG